MATNRVPLNPCHDANFNGPVMRQFSSLFRWMPLLLVGPALAACVPPPQSEGESVYRLNCAACHGPAGAGDGPLAADLPVPPADLRGLAAANGGVFPAERVMATVHGYRGKDFLGLMPEFGSVLDGPTVMWQAPDGQLIETPRALVALTDYLETLQDR